MPNILTSETAVRLLRAKMPEDQKWTDVFDKRLGAEQQQIIKSAQMTLGIKEPSTFCLGTRESGERVIVQPKLVQGADGNPAIKWGKNSYPLPPAVNKLEDITIRDNAVVASILGYSFALGFCDTTKIKESELTKEQKMLRGASDPLKRMELVAKLPLSRLGSILHKPSLGFTKLIDLKSGDYTVVAYEMAISQFGPQYKLTLADGVKVDGNTAVKRICEEWDAMGVNVSSTEPATLVVGGTSLTKTGKTMVQIELYSYQDMTLEPFDFTENEASELVEESEDFLGSLVEDSVSQQQPEVLRDLIPF